jgi:hypothetical protein
MHHSDYEIRLLAEQRGSELGAQAERLNQLHDARRRQRRFRSLLLRFRRPAPNPTVIDLREPPPPEPAPNPPKATDAAKGTSGAMHSRLRF